MSDKLKPSSQPFQKKEKRIKLVSDGLSDIPLGVKPGLGENSVFYVKSSGGAHRQLTLHRRIGIDPGIRDDEWVISESTDLPTLLARVDDPSTKARKDAIRNFMTEAVASAHPDVLVQASIGGRLVYAYPMDTQSRDDRTREARRLAKAANAETAASNPTAFISYLPEEFRGHESRIRGYLGDPELERRAEARLGPSTYVTMGGPRGDRRQVILRNSRGLTLDAVTDRLMMQIMNGLPDPPGRTAPMEPGPELPDIDDTERPVAGPDNPARPVANRASTAAPGIGTAERKRSTVPMTSLRG